MNRFLTPFAGALLIFFSTAASAATFLVDRTDDISGPSVAACTSAPNDCTLRGAIAIANNTSGADTITLPANTYKIQLPPIGHTLPNSNGELFIDDPVTINGAGAKRTIVDGNSLDRVLLILLNFASTGKVTLNGFTITNGKSPGPGGGLWIKDSNATLNRMIVKNNVTIDALSPIPPDGGGVFVQLSDDRTVTISRSTIVGNVTAPGGIGGGVAAVSESSDTGTLRLINNTISSNRTGDGASGAAGNGGGVAVTGDAVTAVLNNDTVTDNATGLTGATPGDGGGLFLVATNPAKFTVSNTLLARNTVAVGGNGADCTGNFKSKGHNFVTDGGACPAIVNGTNNDIVGGDPKLDPAGLKFNRVGTQSLALLADSPAVDKGDDATCALIDARGIARPQGAACDIGAYERGICGDDFLEPEEECDDHNTANGDGCSSTCTDEVPGAVCGNDILESTEECDDGNTADGDGCSAACQTESVPDDGDDDGTTTGDATGGVVTGGETTSGDTTGGTTDDSSGGCSLTR